MASMQPGGPDQPGNQYGGAGNGMGGGPAPSGWGGVVADETLCAKCGYALRGLPLDGACPECNTTVQQTLSMRRLHMADGTWLATVAKGLRVAWITLSVLAAYSLLLGIINVGMSFSGNSSATLIVLLSLPSTLAVGARLWAWWLITTPDPTPNAPTDNEQLRIWNRRLIIAEGVASGLTLLLNIALLAAGFFEKVDNFQRTLAASKGKPFPNFLDIFTPFEGVLYAGQMLLSFALFGLLLASFFCGTVFLRRLALRAGDTETVKLAKTTMIAAPICAVVLGCVFGLGMIIAFGLWLMLLRSSERMIRKCLEWQAQWLPRA